MKKKHLIMIALLALAVAALATACSSGLTREDIDDRYGDYVRVSYDIGEGSWEGRDSVDVDFLYKPKEGGVYALEPGTDKLKDAKPSRAGYFIEGWYRNAEFTAESRWNYSTDRTSESITLYAHWLPNYRYTYCYVDEQGNEVAISSREVGSGDLLSTSTSAVPSRDGYTFLGTYYSDPACQTEWDFNFRHPGRVENGVQKDMEVRVYTQWLKGTYTIVRSAADITQTALTNTDLWLLADVDFGEVYEGTTAFKYTWGGSTLNFSRKIFGNGHKIKNITLEFPNMNTGRAATYGLFASLKEGAEFHDVTFENVQMTIDGNASWTHSIGLFAGETDYAVVFDNAAIVGELLLKRIDDTSYCTAGLVFGEINGNSGKVPGGLDYSRVTLSVATEATFTATLAADGNGIVFAAK